MAQECSQPLPSLIHWWPADGNTNDLEGGISGSWVGPSNYVTGKVNDAFRFTGAGGMFFSNKFIFHEIQDATVEFWVNPDDPFFDQAVFWTRPDSSDTNRFNILVDNGNIIIDYRTPSGGLHPLGATSLPQGQWTHIAFVRSIDPVHTYQIYKNGALVTSTGDPSPNLPTVTGWHLAERSCCRFRGNVDEVSFYDEALTSEQIKAIFDAGSSGKCTDFGIVDQNLTSVKIGEFFSDEFETSQGTDPITWELLNGSIPNGTMFSDGILNGTPSEAGVFTFTLRATDDNNVVAERTFTKQVFVTLPEASVRISKWGTVAVPGRVLDYFIFFENTDNVVAENLSVLEHIEPWFTFVSSIPEITNSTSLVFMPNETNYTYPENVTSNISVIWDVESLEPGEIKVFNYKVLFDEEAPLGLDVSGPACGGKKLCDQELANCLRDARKKCGLIRFFPFGFAECINIATAICQQAYNACIASEAGDLHGGHCGGHTQPSTQPVDPNEKGVSEDTYIQSNTTLIYSVYFENIGNTSALDVFITDTLEEDLDVSTVTVFIPNETFVPISDGETITLLERNKTKTINVTVGNDTIEINITILENWTVTLDGSLLSWDLLGIDLEPNATDAVLFTILPDSGLPSGTEIRNNATIQFEIFETIVTNDTVNIIDDIAPNCTMDPLPAESENSFTISWSGTDAVGEIDTYTIFMSDGGGFNSIFTGPNTSIIFNGEPATTYEFICIATDTAGNVEVQAPVAEAITTTLFVDANGPYSVDEGGAVNLTGTGIGNFSWDLDNDGVFETLGQNVTFSAANRDGPDTQIVVLQACNTTCATDNATVDILNVPPALEMLLNMTSFVNQTVTINSSFTDPGIPDIHKAKIDFGDGLGFMPATVVPTQTGGYINETYIYSAVGRYRIGICVRDDDRESVCDKFFLTVLEEE